jgi:riboflavin kinase/FMN adenylyltransferase
VGLHNDWSSLELGIIRAATIGNFDGVHLGHQTIIKRLLESAQKRGETTLAVTFSNHTAAVVRHHWPPLLMSVEERVRVLEELGVHEVLLLDFTEELSKISAEKFLTRLTDLGVQNFVVGHDFRCGAGRHGDTAYVLDFAKRNGFRAEVIDAVRFNGEIVSSTRIRSLLAEGNAEEASLYLGRPFSLEGEVCHGEARGRTLGFPTANLNIELHRLVPRLGVYLVQTIIAQEIHYGLANVGIKPTFKECPPLVEVHIFDFNRDIYGHYLKVEFLAFLRPEKRFASAKELVEQMELDKVEGKMLLQRLGR